jgi:hypothetical protein
MWAILQGAKRGCAEVPEEFIIATMRKHQAALTQELPRLSEEDAERFRVKFRSVWRRRRELRAGGDLWTAWDVNRRMAELVEQPANPGFNATFETTRKEGGRAGYVRRWALQELAQFDIIPEGLSVEQWPLWRMSERAPGDVVEERVGAGILPTLTPKFATKLANLTLDRTEGTCAAEVAGILEPLKCRLITKGSALAYWAAQPFQKAMWQRLQDYKAFRLTGRPLMESDLHTLWQQTQKVAPSFDKWVSGDYSAATDGLSQQINALCLEEAVRAAGLDDAEAKVARAVLGNHRIHYPADKFADWPEDLPKKIMQSNGQLMGSVLSFPILCCINVCAYWIALEDYFGSSFSLDELPVMVNGDDIAFMANDDFYEVWKKWTSTAGFTLSAGKNYISPDFVTINSEGFVPTVGTKKIPGGTTKTISFTKVGFLQTGLLYAGKSETEVDWRDEPKVKVGARVEHREMPFVPKINAILAEACDPRRALKRVHAFYRDEIQFHTHRGEISLHACPELGGLGVTIPDGHSTYFTAWQQRVAGFLRHRWKSLDFGTKLEGDSPLWDLNSPMRLEGRLTYKQEVSTALKPVHPVRPGTVVVRKKLEPCRPNEKPWRMPDSPLMNYQGSIEATAARWKIAQLSSDLLDQARAYKGSSVLEPTMWDEEVREVCESVALEDASSPKGLAPLRRTDSHCLLSYVTDDGELVTFRSKPILVGR